MIIVEESVQGPIAMHKHDWEMWCNVSISLEKLFLMTTKPFIPKEFIQGL